MPPPRARHSSLGLHRSKKFIVNFGSTLKATEGEGGIPTEKTQKSEQMPGKMPEKMRDEGTKK